MASTNIKNTIIEKTTVVVLILHINKYNSGYISSAVSKILTTNYVINERTHLNFIKAIKTTISNIIIDNFTTHNYILYIIHCILHEYNTNINIDKYSIYDIINILNIDDNTLHANAYLFIYILLVYSYNKSNYNSNIINSIDSTSGVDLIDGLYYEIRFNASNNINYSINNYIKDNQSID